MNALSEITLSYQETEFGTDVIAQISNNTDLIIEKTDSFNWWGLFNLFYGEDAYPAYLFTCNCGSDGCGGFTPFVRVKNKDKHILMVKYNNPLSYPMGNRQEYVKWDQNRKLKIARFDLIQVLNEIEKLIAHFEKITKNKEKIPYFTCQRYDQRDTIKTNHYWKQTWKDYKLLVQEMKHEFNYIQDVLKKEGRIK